MEGSAFDESWSSLPVLLRAQLFIIIPVFVVYLFLFGTREMLARNIALDDLPSSEEILSEDENFEQLDSLIVDERDRKLIEHIARLEDQQIKDFQQVGIVYGARHMLLICADPDKIRRGYRSLLSAARKGHLSESRMHASLRRIAATKAIAGQPLPLDLDRFHVLADEINKLNSKLNYTYGGTIK